MARVAPRKLEEPQRGRTPRQGWLREAGGLTVAATGGAPTDQLHTGELAAAALTLAAHALVADAEALGACPVEAAALATALAEEPCVVPEPTVEATTEPRRDPLAVYLDALDHAATAAGTCRRLAHPGGRCWFSAAGPDAGVCGTVLATAHRLDSRR